MADINGDTYVNGLDVQPFIDVLLAYDTAAHHIAAADLNGDGNLNEDDIQLFVDKLLNP